MYKINMNVYSDLKCTSCNREMKHKKNTVELCHLCKRKSSKLARRISASNYKNNKCEICGLKRKTINDLELFDFHHINQDNKSFDLSDKMHSRKWEEIKNELDKCMMLCANCHRKQHFINRNETVMKYAEKLIAKFR